MRFTSPVNSLADSDDQATFFGVTATGWRALALGAVIAGVVFRFPLLRFITSTMLTLVHETGHAIAGWLLGYPSIPAFDFVYGGGVTMRHDRVVLLPILVVATLAYNAHRLWANRRGRRLVLAILVVYCAMASSHAAQEIVITAAGHGGELLFAAIFLHRALSGRGCRLPIERPLYGFLACFVLASDLGFAWNLATSVDAQRLYADAKGGGHWMDFSRLAIEWFGTSVPRVALMFMACVIATPVLGWHYEMHRARIARWLGEALETE